MHARTRKRPHVFPRAAPGEIGDEHLTTKREKSEAAKNCSATPKQAGPVVSKKSYLRTYVHTVAKKESIVPIPRLDVWLFYCVSPCRP